MKPGPKKGTPSPLRGRVHPNRGKSLIEIHGKEKAADILLRNIAGHLGKSSGMKGKIPWNKGNRVSENRGGMKDLSWIKAVLEKDKYICQSCGITEIQSINKTGRGLHAHHIKDWDNFPDLRFDLENGLAVCHTCHPKLEGKHNWYTNGLVEKMFGINNSIPAGFILGRLITPYKRKN